MGSKLLAYFTEADTLGGLEAKIKLAVLTRVTSTQAQGEADSESTVRAFEQAMAHLRSQYRSASGVMPADPGGGFGADRTPTTRRRMLPGGEDLLLSVLSSLHDAMVAVFDAQGVCLLAWESRSLAAKYGARAGRDPIGDTIAKLVAREYSEAIHAQFMAPRPVLGEQKLQLGTTEVWLSVALSPVYDSAGTVTAVAAFIQDVTARKQGERRIQESEERLRAHNQAFLKLMAQKSSFLPELDKTLRRVTETAANTLGLERVSVWWLDEKRSKITCADLYEQSPRKHSAGVELLAKDFPAYFKAMLEERTIAAHNAHTDPRTSDFSAPYLTPLGINSMLDVPIWVAGEMIGVLCHEHVGPVRTWTADEENFAYLLGSFVAISRERTS